MTSSRKIKTNFKEDIVMAKSKAKKAKIKILFDAELAVGCMDKYAGRKASKVVVETVRGLTLSGVKAWLKESLDVAILPGGEPYRPTDEQLKASSFGQYVTDPKELKRMGRRYRHAFDIYIKTFACVERLPGEQDGLQTTGLVVVRPGETVKVSVAE